MTSFLPSSSSFNNNDNSLALSAPHGIVPASYSLDTQTCHIHTLPTEPSSPGDVFDPSAAQWVVGRVCRKWAQVGAACYDLWRSITVTVLSAVWCPNPVRILREVVSRSGEHPLHITFDLSHIDLTSEDFGPEIYLQLLALLMHVSPRWVSADFRGLVPSCARALDAVTEKLPQLEALTIDFDDSVQVEEIHAFSDAPRLRAVYIDYAPQRMMDTRSLVSLVSPSGYFTTEMLSECPKLESLTAYGITSSSTDAGGRRTLKSITQISLGHDDQLDFFDLPNLVELEIATSLCPELTVTNFLEHSRCPLRKLSLLRCQRSCLQFVKVLRLTPTIEEVIIEFDDFFWSFKFTEMILFLEGGGGGEDEAERRRERGLRAGLESLMDFVGIVKSSKLLPDPPLSLPCLDQFCLSFESLQSDEAQLLHSTFSNQSIVQAFLLEGIAFSLRPLYVGIM
ncbi:hypothetical protein BDZ89DRAFT_1046909 [Hymenopellis radicata]|nr:hypothetical protein BDZ89DRAFT_1046909 [Hymenopellis radicata]